MNTDLNPPSVVAPPLAIYGVAFSAAWVLEMVHHLPIANGVWRVVLGWTLIAGGFGVVRWAFRTLSHAGTTGDPYGVTTKLVVHGPFAYSRNPIYIAMTGLYLGATLVVNTWWPLILLPAVILTMQIGVIRREERRLERQFGAVYHAYAARVRRWF